MDGVVSRRGVMRVAGAAGLTLIVDRTLPAQQAVPGGTDVNPFVFALVTDTHLGRTGELDVEKWKTAVREISATPGVEVVFCCGDLVNDGQAPQHEKQYPRWVEIANGLTMPWHAVPGNHDPREVFRKHVRPETDFVVDRPPFRFICFADALVNPHHDGAVTPEQVKWIDSALDKAHADGRKAFLLAHVTYHKNEKPDRGWFIEAGREELGKVLEKHADTIVAFFAGHHHVGLRGWDDNWGIHEVVLPSNTWNSDEGIRNPKDGYWEPDLREGWTLATVTGNRIELRVRPVGVPGSGVMKKLS